MTDDSEIVCPFMTRPQGIIQKGDHGIPYLVMEIMHVWCMRDRCRAWVRYEDQETYCRYGHELGSAGCLKVAPIDQGMDGDLCDVCPAQKLTPINYCQLIGLGGWR